MSEEKLYAVKNDEGKYWDFSDSTGFWSLVTSDHPITPSKEQAEQVADNKGGHVVTLIGEAKKVVLTKEQAEIVEGANESQFPADYITQHTPSSDDEKLIMNAYVNGYTVAKEKKYLVYKELGGKQKNKQVAQAYRSVVFPNTIKWLIKEREIMHTPACAQFTEAEIEHYGLQDCEKEEVTDDEV